jgi:flagellar basal body L-ring protein FlgH
MILFQVQKKHNVLSKMPPRSPVGSQTTIADTPDNGGAQQAPASPPQNTGVPVRFSFLFYDKKCRKPQLIIFFRAFK